MIIMWGEDVLINLTVVSNHHTVQLKFTQRYMSIIPQKSLEKINSSTDFQTLREQIAGYFPEILMKLSSLFSKF